MAAHDGVVLAASRRYDDAIGWVGSLDAYKARLDAKHLWATLPIVVVIVAVVTFVVGAEMTRRRLAERAVHMIMASRPKVMGAVLNRVNFDRNKYYYSRYYGYQYKSYYAEAALGALLLAAGR